MDRPRRGVLATALAIVMATSAHEAASQPGPIRPPGAPEELAVVERGLAIVRLDPRIGARRGECDDLAMGDLAITVDKRPAQVVAVERVPRPERHWLLLDISESAEGRRLEAMRSAAQYVDSVMIPGEDLAALVTVDEDPILLAAPSSDPEELEEEIAAIPPGGWSALLDGLDVVLRQILGDRHEHVILYWTDGEDQASTARAEDLLETIARVPNATIFPISLLPKGAKFPPPPQVGAIFTEVARRTGGEVFSSSDPRWLDRVRGWLGRRFTVTYVPPQGSEAGGSEGKRAVITTPRKRCSVTLLPDPFSQPAPVAGAAPPLPGSWVRAHGRTPEADEPSCATVAGTAAWSWPLDADTKELTGCLLDVVRASGPIVRVRRGAPTYSFQSPRFGTREIRVAAPALPSLPTDPVTAVGSIVPDDDADPWDPSPYFMDGDALLVQRAPIAASLFASRPDLHEFAVARLTRSAKDELRAIERDFARAFPDLTAQQIAAVARASRAGMRALTAAQTPTDTDLANVLAAWIADISAADLLRRYEARLINARLSGGPDPGAEARWAAVRAPFAVPSRTRIVAPLALIHDPAQDVVGFVRVVLPRPEGFRKPAWWTRADEIRPSDRIVRRPLALGLVDSVLDAPGVETALAAGGYRVASIAYGDIAPVFRHEPGQPFEQARVTVVLEAEAATQGALPPRVVLEADVSADRDGPVNITQFMPAVVGDLEIAALLRRVRATPRPRSRPSRGPCCGRRRGSSRARAARG